MESIVAHAVCTKVRAWMRDMDTEAGGPDALNLTNDGGVLWVLGQKTEDFRRTSMDPQRPPPLFVVDGHFSATYTSWGPGIPFADLVCETRGREVRNLSRDRAGGAAALFVGYTQPPRHGSRP